MIDDLQEKMRLIRTERYALQSVAKKALPTERVSKCLRFVASSDVSVWQHLKTKKAFYGGLQVCGSVWHCPICASKISEKRRLELQQAFELYKNEGGNIAFLTLTFSHKKFDSLKDILDKFTQASRRFKSGRNYQRIKSMMDIEGTIKGLEVTYSNNNGFHPHTHEIIFYKNKIDLKLLEDMLYQLYKSACDFYGLKITRKRGLTLQSGKDANDYLSKFGKGNWTLEQEMTKAHIKKGKNEKSLTPFDFLKFYFETEDKKYLQLFREYAHVFKGKRQLVWSKGLKSRFIVEDKTDAELANEKIEDADLLGNISFEDWKLIIYYDDRSKLLDTIEKYGFDLGVKKRLDILKKIKGDTIKDTAK